ncbi:MAG: D-alanyl-D-alanine carboxypeptidase [Clostridiales bacterium]|jgi:D-alanyl-D-alanine carboxypeptidase (penicillin-binding protein 5/6)|nr:D-alanyl-D-alanine carboxypeptidase [Clostridiales bacterium]
MRKRRRKRNKRSIVKYIVYIFLIMGCLIIVDNFLLPEKNEADSLILNPTLTEEMDRNSEISTDNLSSSCAILVCLDDKKVLMEKNIEKKIYPASLTKIMTAIVAIENLPDLDKKILLPADMLKSLKIRDASLAGFMADEEVPIIDLLYGVLLSSGAECCIGLSDAVAGSEENFAKLMNQKAKKLGMKSTHFTDTIGLHDPNHYTTVKDLSILLQYALKNDTFRNIFTTSRHSTEPTNRHNQGITLHSTMFKNITDSSIEGGKILGGKTGYTEQAGLCLASLARKDGKEYILVTAGAKGGHGTEQYNITDAFTVYNRLEGK